MHSSYSFLGSLSKNGVYPFFFLLVVYFPVFFWSSFWFSLTWWLWFDLHRHFFLLCFFLLRGCLTIRRRKCKRVPVAIVSTVPLQLPFHLHACVFVASFLLCMPSFGFSPLITNSSALSSRSLASGLWPASSFLLFTGIVSVVCSCQFSPSFFFSPPLSIFICTHSWATSEFISGCTLCILYRTFYILISEVDKYLIFFLIYVL